MKRLLLALTLGIAACASTAMAADKPAAAAPADEVKEFTGKVAETMNAASYTYVLVDTGKEKLWAAAPQFPVKVGDTVKVTQAIAMPNYHSKTLNRDFDVVYFTGSIGLSGQKPAAAGHASEPGALPPGHPPVGAAAAPAAPDLKGIKKAGQTVEQIVTGRTKLTGKPVEVRGKVVKYNGGVMGKNWLHIRDGSGTDGSNDLTVTTQTDAKIGDTVLVSGKVSTDRDFGGGYRYAVIIEDAKVTVE